MTARVRFLLVVLAACGHPPHAPPPTPPPEERAAILASEITASGVHLVAIDEHGDRRFVAVADSATTALDTNPVVSPDGRWVVFESTRERALDQKSLWIAKVGVEQPAARLTTGTWIDAHPAWTRDGSAIVFASTRDGGDFDLWRLPMANGRAAGDPVQLTHDDQQEVTPAVARDGTLIYMAAERDAATGQIASSIVQRAPDGTTTTLVSGHVASPALSPDDSQLAFTQSDLHDGRMDTELYVLRRSDGTRQRVVELPPSDEGGPVWSRDGRFLFATSVLRGDQGALFSSVIHVDLTELPPKARMLEDHAGGIKRLTPAIVATRLDAAALRSNPEYLPELARIMQSAIERAKEQQP